MESTKQTWKTLTRSVRFVDERREYDVWQEGGPCKWRYTVMQDGIYVARGSGFQTQDDACAAALAA